jgi:hypothetical protein
MVWNKGLTGKEYKKHYKKGMKGTFKKGHKSKGGLKKGQINQTSFKKGQDSWNKAKEGEIRIWTSNRESRNWIKIKGKWKKYSRYLWEKEIGKIPTGMQVHHKNENTLDDRIENYELKSSAEHMNIHRPKFKKPKTKPWVKARWDKYRSKNDKINSR